MRTGNANSAGLEKNGASSATAFSRVSVTSPERSSVISEVMRATTGKMRRKRYGENSGASGSNAEAFLALQITGSNRLPRPRREYRFCPDRRWRFDFAWPEQKVALEVQGGQWVKGRHVRGKGFERDCEKFSAAAILGWRVLPVTTDMVNDGRALRWLEQALK